MKAMILAAGLGTRLRPLTENRPKALVEIAGRTLLEITLLRLRSIGVVDVIVNTHHFADMIVEYLEKNCGFGMKVKVSHEDILLDTGGGLKQAASFFLNGSNREEPFILHNVDVVTTIDLLHMVQFHKERRALATLAVKDRKTSRYLLFDPNGELCGRQLGQDATAEMVRQTGKVQALAFCGVHVISTRLLEMFREEGAFSIIETYLRLAREGQRIVNFRADEYYWRDVGKPESLAQVADDLTQNRLAIPTIDRPSSR